MARDNNVAVRWCHLRHNQALRTAVKLKIKNYNVAQVCRDVGVSPFNFYGWLRGDNPKRISQWKLYRFCNKIGINVGIKIEYEA